MTFPTINAVSKTLLAWLFFVIGTFQMLSWAVKKHKNYKKEFGNEYPKGRKIMFPFIY